MITKHIKYAVVVFKELQIDKVFSSVDKPFFERLVEDLYLVYLIFFASQYPLIASFVDAGSGTYPRSAAALSPFV